MSQHPPAPLLNCKDCDAPLGGFSLRCAHCGRALGGGEERKRVRRVLFAFDRLVDDARSAPFTELDAGFCSLGVALVTAALTYRFAWFIALPAAVAAFWAVRLPLRALARRLRRADHQWLFDNSVWPMLRAFMRDRELTRERFDEIAKGSLKRAHPLSAFLPLEHGGVDTGRAAPE